MKNKFVSLILGLMVILIAPAVTTSCVGHAQEDEAERAAFVQPEFDHVVCGLAFAQYDFAAPEIAAVNTAEAPGEQAEAGLFGWQNILIAILGIFATLFGSLWKRARSTLSAINEGLEDGSLTKAEIATIVRVWKGE